MNNTRSPEEVSVEKVMKKKNGIANNKLNIAKRVENASAFSLNNIFFSRIAADAEKKAEVSAKRYHVMSRIGNYTF
jgi:hypothetical protein